MGDLLLPPTRQLLRQSQTQVFRALQSNKENKEWIDRFSRILVQRQRELQQKHGQLLRLFQNFPSKIDLSQIGFSVTYINQLKKVQKEMKRNQKYLDKVNLKQKQLSNTFQLPKGQTGIQLLSLV